MYLYVLCVHIFMYALCKHICLSVEAALLNFNEHFQKHSSFCSKVYIFILCKTQYSAVFNSPSCCANTITFKTMNNFSPTNILAT